MNPQHPSPALLRLVAQLLPPPRGDAGPVPGLPEVPLERLRHAVGPVLRGRAPCHQRPREPLPAAREAMLRRVSGWMQAWGPALGLGCPVPRRLLLGWIEERLAPEEGTLALRESAGAPSPASWEARCRALAASAHAMGSPEGRRVAAMLRSWEQRGAPARGDRKP